MHAERDDGVRHRERRGSLSECLVPVAARGISFSTSCSIRPDLAMTTSSVGWRARGSGASASRGVTSADVGSSGFGASAKGERSGSSFMVAMRTQRNQSSFCERRKRRGVFCSLQEEEAERLHIGKHIDVGEAPAISNEARGAPDGVLADRSHALDMPSMWRSRRFEIAG
jgi:hypothetical protein